MENVNVNVVLTEEKKKNLVFNIDKLIKKNRKNKALLSLKYDDISSKINFVQVSVIVVSTGITFLETLKSKYDINDDIGTILPIIFSTYIALVLAIVRFFKLDEKKEEISKTIQNYNFIINKLRKTINTLKLFQINNENVDKWNNLCSNYENDTYDFIVSTRESFDNIMPFKSVNYYKKKYKKILLDYRFVNNELKTIDSFHNKVNHLNYDKREHWCLFLLKKMFCCRKRKILYYNFLNDVEQMKIEEVSDDEDDDDKLEDNIEHTFKATVI